MAFPVLVLVILILVLPATAFLFKRFFVPRDNAASQRKRSSRLNIAILILLAGLPGLGPVVLELLTAGRASIEETLPWLILIAVALALLWLGFGKKRFLKKTASTPVAGRETIVEAKSSEMVETAPAAALSNSSKVHNIFISYRRSDSADVTGRIYDRLLQEFGRPGIFKDVDSVPLGVDFRRHLDRVVGDCEILIAVIGDAWLGTTGTDGQRRLEDPRDLVRIEVQSALKRDIPVIPVLVRGASMPEEQDLPAELKALAYRNGMQVRPDPDFHKDVDRLIEGITRHFESLSGVSAQPAPSLADPASTVAPDLSGKWKAPVTYSWGEVHEERFAFRVDGDRLTGTVSYLGHQRGFVEGRVRGNQISFVVLLQELIGNETRSYQTTYNGVVVGDGIRFQVADDRGNPPTEFLAVKDTLG